MGERPVGVSHDREEEEEEEEEDDEEALLLFLLPPTPLEVLGCGLTGGPGHSWTLRSGGNRNPLRSDEDEDAAAEDEDGTETPTRSLLSSLMVVWEPLDTVVVAVLLGDDVDVEVDVEVFLVLRSLLPPPPPLPLPPLVLLLVLTILDNKLFWLLLLLLKMLLCL